MLQFLRTQSFGVPLRIVGVVNADKGRLAAHGQPDVRRLELFIHRPDGQIREVVTAPQAPPLFQALPRNDLSVEADAACASALRTSAPVFSRSYFVPLGGGQGREVMDLCLLRLSRGQPDGFIVASFTLHAVLDAVLPVGQAQRHELSFIESDGARLVRAGARP